MLMFVPAQSVMHVHSAQGVTWGPLTASKGVSDSLLLNHSMGEIVCLAG